MLLAALTGNYGMGKSTVLHLFKNLGAVTVQTDEIVQSLLRDHEVRKRISGLLGETILDNTGRLNKKKVADLVFTNTLLRQSLEDILHPLVFERINLLLNKINCRDQVIIVEIPLLFERGYEDRFDRTITVFAEEENTLNRLEAAGIDRDTATLRMRSQLAVEEKMHRSDYVIDNNNELEQTTDQVEMIYKKLLREAEDGNNQRT